MPDSYSIATAPTSEPTVYATITCSFSTIILYTPTGPASLPYTFIEPGPSIAEYNVNKLDNDSRLDDSRLDDDDSTGNTGNAKLLYNGGGLG